MRNRFVLAAGAILVCFSIMALPSLVVAEPEDKSRPLMVTTASRLEEAPQKYAGSIVQMYSCDLSLAFRDFESSDPSLAPFITAQINGRGHVRGVETKIVFLLPKELRERLLREHEKKNTIHADILVRVRAQNIPTRGGEITHVAEIVRVQEVEPK